MNTFKASAAPLRWLSDTQRSRLTNRLQDAIAPVLHDWREGSAALPAVHRVSEINAICESVYKFSSEGQTWATWWLHAAGLKQLLGLPAGSCVQQSSLLSRVEQDFMEALSRAVVPQELQGAGCALAKESGPVCPPKKSAAVHLFELGLAGQSACASLLLSAQTIELLAPRAQHKSAASLATRRQAIGHQDIALRSTLGQAEVPFRELKKLAIGDVLVLQASLTAPVTLANDKGQAVLEGTLGCRDRQLAVRVTEFSQDIQAKAAHHTKRSIR